MNSSTQGFGHPDGRGERAGYSFSRSFRRRSPLNFMVVQRASRTFSRIAGILSVVARSDARPSLRWSFFP